MNPISALRTFLTPAIAPAAPPGQQPGGVPMIKPAELESLPGIASIQAPGQVGASNASFDSVLKSLVTGVSQKQQVSAETVNALLSGQNVSLHQAMIAMEEASVSFHLMVEVRNKLLESYQELMRMQM